MIKLFGGLLCSRHYVEHFTPISSHRRQSDEPAFFTPLFSSPRNCSAGRAPAGAGINLWNPVSRPTRRPRRNDGGPGVGGSLFPAGPRPWALRSAAPARSARRLASPTDVRSLPSRRLGPGMRSCPVRASSRCVRRTRGVRV